MNQRKTSLVEPTAKLEAEFLAMANEFLAAGDERYNSENKDFSGYLERLSKFVTKYKRLGNSEFIATFREEIRMLKIKQIIVSIILQSVCLFAAAFPQTKNSARIESFDISAFIQESILKTKRTNFRLISDYTYKMRRTVNSPNGKTTTTLFESYFPSRLNKQRENRGIIIVLEENGAALSAKKIEKQRREAGKKLEKAGNAPDEKSTLLEAKRANGLPLDWTYNVAVGLNTFLEGCKFTAPLREKVDRRETISLTFGECSAGGLPETKSYLANIQGKVWFDATDKIPIRLESWLKASHSTNDARVSPKTTILFTQQRVADGVWFPAAIRVQGIGNETVFPTLKLNWRIEFFDYKLPETDIKDVRINSK